MILPKGDVEAVTCQTGEHPALAAVYLRGDFVEATNVNSMVKVRVDRQSKDKDGPIPVLAFELARRLNPNKDAPTVDLSRPKIIGVPGIAGVNRPEFVRQAPLYADLVAKTEVERPHEVVIDAALLLKVARAINESGRTSAVRLQFSGNPLDAVRVVPLAAGSENEALVMPIRPPEDVVGGG